MPCRAMMRAGNPIVSTPSKTIEPFRLGRMPMIDFMVVVLPAPLRPSRVTTSPGKTSKPIPCRTWDSPYQALRSRTARSGAVAAWGEGATAAALLAMTHSDVSLDDAGVFRHGRVISLREDLPARQNRDPVGEPLHDRKVMLDHQDGAVGRDAADQLRGAVDVLVAHAGHRLLEGQHLGGEGGGGGALQRPLSAIGQFDRRNVGKFGQADRLDQRGGVRIERVQHLLGAPEVEVVAAPTLQRDAHVLKHGQVREHARDLERADEPKPRDVVRLHRGDVAAVVLDRAPRDVQELGQKIEAGRLPGPVRADERVDRPALNRQVDIADRRKALELLRETLGRKNGVLGHKLHTCRRLWFVLTGYRQGTRMLHVAPTRVNTLRSAIQRRSNHLAALPSRPTPLKCPGWSACTRSRRASLHVWLIAQLVLPSPDPSIQEQTMSAAASLKRNESLDSLRQRVASFVEERIMPIEADRANFDEHENIRLDVLEDVRAAVKQAGLWAPQMPRHRGGLGQTF